MSFNKGLSGIILEISKSFEIFGGKKLGTSNPRQIKRSLILSGLAICHLFIFWIRDHFSFSSVERFHCFVKSVAGKSRNSPFPFAKSSISTPMQDKWLRTCFCFGQHTRFTKCLMNSRKISFVVHSDELAAPIKSTGSSRRN